MDQMKWEQTGKTVRANGERTIEYRAAESPCRIESRRRNIPHANGIGYWQRTTYFVILPDGTETERYSLASAKEWAEGMIF